MKPNRTVRPLKAYAVQDEDEGMGGIVFDRTSIAALKTGACEFGGGDIHGWKARRAPWADRFALKGDVPVRAMLEAGWWLTCHGCERKISDDFEDDEDGAPMDPIGNQRVAYCSPACCNRHAATKARRKIAEQAAILKLTKELARRFPGVWTVGTPHAYVSLARNGRSYLTQQCVIAFEFPGCRIGPAQFAINEVGQAPQLYVCSGDHDAWLTWRGLQP